MIDLLQAIAASPIYQVAMWFLASFPIVISLLAINGSRQYLLDRSRDATEMDFPHLDDLRLAREKWPLITVIIPARNEESVIARTIESVRKMNWPKLELIVVNDGSSDHTELQITNELAKGAFRLVTNPEAKGKSASLNAGLRLASSDLVLIMDADAKPASNALNRMVPHLLGHPDVVAVTGNPRVTNANTLLAKLQAIEFTSTISTLRRGQSAWGRVNTMSGIMTVLRREVVLKHGGFSEVQPTEDIELTWRLHREGYRCIYEPAAQVAMEVPETLSQWWRQRSRWSSGLVRVLQTHGFGVLRKWEWPVFPILLEAITAIIWCHLLVIATLFWVVSSFFGLPLLGNSVLIGHWGTMTVGIALIQILWGMHLDSNHDRNIGKLWPLAPLYPLAYWWLSAIAVVATTIPTLLSKPKLSAWSLERKAAERAVE